MWVEQLQVCDITIPRLRAMESLQDAVKTSGGFPAWVVESIGEMPAANVNDWRIGAWDSVFNERQTTWTNAQKKKAKWAWDEYMKEYMPRPYGNPNMKDSEGRHSLDGSRTLWLVKATSLWVLNQGYCLSPGLGDDTLAMMPMEIATGRWRIYKTANDTIAAGAPPVPQWAEGHKLTSGSGSATPSSKPDLDHPVQVAS